MPVAIGRGENNGRTLTYYNVVRRWVKLGDLERQGGDASACRWPIFPMATIRSPTSTTLAVVVQSGVAAKPGLMLGAATVSLR